MFLKNTTLMVVFFENNFFKIRCTWVTQLFNKYKL